MPDYVGPELRKDIPDSYINAFEQDGAVVIHYLVFHWSDGDQYVSDHEYEYSTGLYCDKLVTDWGQLDDSVDIAAAVNGTGNPTREFKLSFANTSDTGWWCSRFVNPPENTKVSVYEVVYGQQPILIDIFILQNLVSYAENELSVSITLVSLNQYSDPYVGPLDPVTNNFYPLVIGGNNGIEGSLYGSHPYAKLDGNIAVGATSILTDRDLSSAGFSSSGTIIIDYDEIAYTGLSGNSFTGCTGVVKSHSNDQYVFVKNHEYLFAFGAGPVDIAGPLYVNGDLYTGQYTIYKDLNPVQVGFPDGFPFLRVNSIYQAQSIASFSAVMGYNGVYVYEAGGVVWMSQAKTTPDELTAMIDLYAQAPSAEYEHIETVVKIDASCYGGAQFRGKVLAGVIDSGGEYKTWNISAPLQPEGSARIQDLYIGDGDNFYIEFYYYATNSSENVFGSFIPELASNSITATYNSPGYPKKAHYDNPALVIGGVGATSNPADVIQWFLDKMGLSEYINAVSFSVAREWYDLVGFEMVGLIDGGKRCSEALKDATRQCRSYLVYDAGEIFLKYRFPVSETPPLYLSTIDRRLPKSIKIQRQELVQADITGKKVTGVTNSLAVRYAPSTIEGEYGSTYNAIDSDSIAKFGLKDAIFDAYLITDSTYAQAIGNFWISQISFPYTVMSFTAIGTGGMLKLRMGCPVRVFTDWSNIYVFDGNVVKISRRFGQISPQRRLNEWDITLVGQLKPVSALQVSEEIDISAGLIDADVALGRGFGDTPFGCGWPGGGLQEKVLYSFGRNQYGQLGLGDNSGRLYPEKLGTRNDWVKVIIGQDYSIALDSSNRLYSFGLNQYGQLGLGNFSSINYPVEITSNGYWMEYEASRWHTLAVRHDGTLWAWGLNDEGQLGDGTTISRNSPVQIGTSKDWKLVSCTYTSSFAIKKDGTLWGWGANAFGQLSDGTTIGRYVPQQIGTDTDWLNVSGCSHSLVAIKQNGTMWACGFNAFGQLGDGTTTNRYYLQQVGTDTDWHMLPRILGNNLYAIKKNGTLWACGYNMYGQVGDGTTTNRHYLQQVGADADWIFVEGGIFHVIAVKSNNTAWAWGYNSDGQLGDGTTVNRYTPQQIAISNKVISAAAGYYHSILAVIE